MESKNSIVVAKVKYFDINDNEVAEKYLKKPIRIFDGDSITLTTVFEVPS